MQENNGLTSEMDAQSVSACNETAITCSLPTEGSVALSVASSTFSPYRYNDEDGKHLHTLYGRPLIGTSTICSEGLPKNGLTWWSAELAAVACLESGQHIPTIREEYLALKGLTGYAKTKARNALQKKYPIFKTARFAHREAKESAAPAGTDMHAVLESYIIECIELHGGEPLWDASVEFGSDAELLFAEWANANVKEFLWAEGHCYSEKLWTGGICDVGMIMKDGGLAVGDFKSTPEAYFSQIVQVGGYSLQIQENGLFRADGKPISSGIRHVPAKALIVFPFGGKTFEPEICRDVRVMQETFAAAVTIYKNQPKYN